MAAGASEIDILDDIIEALKDTSKLDEGIIENLRLQSDSATAAIPPPGSGAVLSAKVNQRETVSGG
jgi:hypothetical protein